MSQRLPTLRPREVIEALQRAGFEVRRQTGSHVILYRPGLRRPISVPLHPGDLPLGTLRAVLRQAELSVEEFIALLQ